MRWCGVVWILAMAAGRLAAQDADTVALKDDARKFTIVSQIDDPREAAAFLAVIQASAAARRHELASAFLKSYPRSWLLPQAYDAAARSAIDLGNLQEALEQGRFSLRLMPENPPLLILLANIEAQTKQFERALEDAGYALEQMDEMERLPGMNASEWKVAMPELKASAYFAKGRAETAQAMMAGRADRAGFARALENLNKAAAWNRDDVEVFYLRAIVEIQLQRTKEAAADLAFVLGKRSSFEGKARNVLAVLCRQTAGQGTSLEDFVKTLPAREVDAKLREDAGRRAYPQALAAGYAGPEACKGCHATEYETWRKTGMARMLRPYAKENIIGDFSPGTAYNESDGDAVGMGFDKRPYFEVSNKRFYVDYTIGSKWQQGYATKLPDGRLQVLPIEYNALRKTWVNYWKLIDPPGSARAVIHDFPKMTAATNYQQNCAICHTSQLKLDAAAEDAAEHAAYLQPGVDCEMCHGPAAWHVKRMAKNAAGHADAEEPPFDFRKADYRAGVRVCAQCHRQSAVREIGPRGEMNYSANGNFVPAAWVRSYDAFSRKAFYKDGRFRETTFIVEAFTRSACYRRGSAQCATCHSPHVGDFEENQTSLKFSKQPNEMCLQCHAGYRNRVAGHSRHAADSEASECVTCHMPRIVNALLFKARSHQIEVPAADLTERFGQEESPNVCLGCHAGKDAGWAKEQLAAWRR